MFLYLRKFSFQLHLQKFLYRKNAKAILKRYASNWNQKEHISLPAEEISKLHTWLCSFDELRDTVVPSERGAQVWRARKPIELNISQVFHFLDTEWKSMHSKMQLLEQHLSDMQLKVKTPDEKSGQNQSLSTTRLQAQNLYNVML